MTKKDLTLIAEILADTRPSKSVFHYEQWLHTRNTFTLMLALHDDHFDKDKFIEATNK